MTNKEIAEILNTSDYDSYCKRQNRDTCPLDCKSSTDCRETFQLIREDTTMCEVCRHGKLESTQSVCQECKHNMVDKVGNFSPEDEPVVIMGVA